MITFGATCCGCPTGADACCAAAVRTAACAAAARRSFEPIGGSAPSPRPPEGACGSSYTPRREQATWTAAMAALAGLRRRRWTPPRRHSKRSAPLPNRWCGQGFTGGAWMRRINCLALGGCSLEYHRYVPSSPARLTQRIARSCMQSPVRAHQHLPPLDAPARAAQPASPQPHAAAGTPLLGSLAALQRQQLAPLRGSVKPPASPPAPAVGPLLQPPRAGGPAGPGGSRPARPGALSVDTGAPLSELVAAAGYSPSPKAVLAGRASLVLPHSPMAPPSPGPTTSKAATSPSRALGPLAATSPTKPGAAPPAPAAAPAGGTPGSPERALSPPPAERATTRDTRADDAKAQLADRDYDYMK
jgi:hypothetical protein